METLILMAGVIHLLVGCVYCGADNALSADHGQCREWNCPAESASCFKIEGNNDGYTWLEANEICRKIGGRLPIIHDRAESVTLELADCLNNPSWLALRRDDGEFRWQPTKVAPSYTKFGCAGDQRREGDCVLYNATDRAWSKANCFAKNKVRQVLCQKWNEASRVELTEQLWVHNREGFVSLAQGGKRGALCLRSWSHQGANVVCKQHLGEREHFIGRVGGRTANTYPNQTGFWFGDEFCNGQEEHLAECIDVKWVAGSLNDQCPYLVASAACQPDPVDYATCNYDFVYGPMPFNVTHSEGIVEAPVGKKLTFLDCPTGQQFVGPRKIECLPNLEWDDLPPDCEDVFCTNPGLPKNAERRGNRFIYNSTVRFRCYDGYKLVGLRSEEGGWSAPLLCTENGTWSDLPPVCVPMNFNAKTCQFPSDLRQRLHLNGYSEAEQVQVGAKVTFSCNSGFTLSGSPVAWCLPNGLFSDIPQCVKEVKCQQPSERELPPHVSFRRQNDELRYTCLPNYLLEQTVASLEKGFPVCDSTGRHLKPPTCLHCPGKAWQFAYKGSCYSVPNTTADWESASLACSQLANRTQLIVIDTAEEAELIAAISTKQKGSFWTGLRVNNSRYYPIAAGQTSRAYEAWACGQPSASNSVECVHATNGKASRWMSGTCKVARPFVCEMHYSEFSLWMHPTQQRETMLGARCRTEYQNGLYHGKIIGLSDRPGSVVQFSCNDGFRLNGTAVRCSAVEGRPGQWAWNTTWPICTRLPEDCKPEELEERHKIANGAVYVHRTPRTCLLEFICNDSFTLVGTSPVRRVFTEDQRGKLTFRWNAEFPRCQATCRPGKTEHSIGTVSWPATNASETARRPCPHSAPPGRQFAIRYCSLSPSGSHWMEPNTSQCSLPPTAAPTVLVTTPTPTTTRSLPTTTGTNAMTELVLSTTTQSRQSSTQPASTATTRPPPFAATILEDLAQNREVNVSTVMGISGKFRQVLSGMNAEQSSQTVLATAAVVEKAAAVNISKMTAVDVQKVAENIVHIVSQISLTNASMLQKSQFQNRSATRLVKSIESFAEAVSRHVAPKQPVKVVAPRLALHVEKSCAPYKGAAYVSRLLGGKPVESDSLRNDQVRRMPFDEDYRGRSEASIKVEMKALDDGVGKGDDACSKPIRTVFSIFQDDSLFAVGEKVNVVKEGAARTVTSRVISAKMDGNGVSVSGVELSFTPLMSGSNPSCQFWDFAAKDGHGDWSNTGVQLVHSPADGEGEYRCKSHHLTNFALLMSVGTKQELDKKHKLALNVITWIGCCASIVCLVITGTVLLCFKRLRSVQHSRVVIALCFMLSFALALFLAIDRTSTENKTTCRTVSALFHFFLLSSFGWMLAEGITIYSLLVQVMSNISYFLTKAAIGAVAIPALIVTFGVVFAGDQYSQSRVCFMDTPLFYYAFYAPVALVVFINTIIFIRAVTTLARHAHYRKQRGVGRKQQRQLSRELSWTVGLTFVLGLTWLIGFVMIKNDHAWVQYVFVVMTTFQGVGIFIFHCLVRRAVRRCFSEVLNSRRRKDSNTTTNRIATASFSHSSSVSSKQGFHSSDNPSVHTSSTQASGETSVGWSAGFHSSAHDPVKRDSRASHQLQISAEKGEELATVVTSTGGALAEDTRRYVPLTAEYRAIFKRVSEAPDFGEKQAGKGEPDFGKLSEQHVHSVTV